MEAEPTRAQVIAWCLNIADQMRPGTYWTSRGTCDRCGHSTPRISMRVCYDCQPEVLTLAAQMLDSDNTKS